MPRTKTAPLTWETPPEHDEATTPTRAEIGAQLEARPGEYAIVGVHDRRARGESQVERINAGTEYGTGFVALLRQVGPQFRVYAKRTRRPRKRADVVSQPLYAAIINTPGYLAEDDPAIFVTPAGAWAFLAGERERAEDEAGECFHTPGCPWDNAADYSETLVMLRELGDATSYTDQGPDVAPVFQPQGDPSDYPPAIDGTLTGDTPGKCTCEESMLEREEVGEQSRGDLGTAYSVTLIPVRRITNPVGGVRLEGPDGQVILTVDPLASCDVCGDDVEVHHWIDVDPNGHIVGCAWTG